MANPEYQRRFQINQVGADKNDGTPDVFKTDGEGIQLVSDTVLESKLDDINTTLQFLQNQLEVLAQVDNKRLKIVIDGGTLPVVTTVTTVSNITNQVRIGDIQASRQIEYLMEQAFYAGYGNNIV